MASTKTKVIGLRVANELAAEWEAAAKAKGIGVAAHVLALAMRGDGRGARPEVDQTSRHPAGPVLKSAVPDLGGRATGFNLKTKGKR